MDIFLPYIQLQSPILIKGHHGSEDYTLGACQHSSTHESPSVSHYTDELLFFLLPCKQYFCKYAHPSVSFIFAMSQNIYSGLSD